MKLVKVRNKASSIKAVKFLGKFSQDKALLNETIKMIEFLKGVNNEK